MFKLFRPVVAAALFVFAGAPAFAADYVEPAPPPEPLPAFGGWYIRGDLDYHWSDFRGAEYTTYGVTCCGEQSPQPNTYARGGCNIFSARARWRASLSVPMAARSVR